MAPTYKLTYFDLTALGEPIRFLMHYGGIEFEDIRVSRENWLDIKPNMPFGQMPILEHNGKVAHQSLAICRYLAKKVKLVGKDDWEDLEIDAVVDTVNDLRMKIGRYHYEADKNVKESLREPLLKEIIPFYLERLETIAKANDGHLAVKRLTWADLYLVSLLNYYNLMLPSPLIGEKHPNLLTVVNNVQNIPSIKSWLEKRPETDRKYMGL